MSKLNAQQFTRVYHTSFFEKPPHEYDPTDDPTIDRWKKPSDEYGNTSPDVFHVGTESAAQDSRVGRPYTHIYDIPAHKMYPVTLGDEDFYLTRPESMKFNEGMRGVQEGLFETVMAEPEYAVETSQVLPYRNRVEDAGSISYIMPKNAIHEDGVIYRGVKGRNSDG